MRSLIAAFALTAFLGAGCDDGPAEPPKNPVPMQQPGAGAKPGGDVKSKPQGAKPVR